MLIKKNKIIISFLFLLLFCFSLISNSKTASAIEFTPQVTIPGSIFEAGTSTEIENSTVTIGKYIKSFYNYLIAIVGLVAAIVLMLAGVIWLTAAGNTSKISQAKGLMMGSFTGIVLVLTSYIVLKTINPGLVEFRDTVIEAQVSASTGCCIISKTDKKIEDGIGGSNCYLKIIENNPNTTLVEKDLEKLKKILKDNKKYENNIDKYMEDKKIFYPNKIADQNKVICDNYIICVLWNYSGGNHEEGKGFIFFKTTSDDCNKKKGIDSAITRSNLNASNQYEAWVLSYVNFNGKNPQAVQALAEKSADSLCSGKGEGYMCKDSKDFLGGVKLYCHCYGGRAYYSYGAENEPCGDDGGICVNTGGNKCSSSGYDGRENGRGGRSCEGNLKCCYKD